MISHRRGPLKHRPAGECARVWRSGINPPRADPNQWVVGTNVAPAPGVPMAFYRVLADLIAASHLALMAYVIFGQLLILVGIVFRWGWIRNPWFRWTHLAAVLTVAAEALLDVRCPVTDWEQDLRALAKQPTTDQSFTEQILDRVLFPLHGSQYEWVLPLCYFGFAGLVLLSFLLAPPGRVAPKGSVALRLGC